jgi:DNA-binding MarR family transcriptional regulator
LRLRDPSVRREESRCRRWLIYQLCSTIYLCDAIHAVEAYDLPVAKPTAEPERQLLPLLDHLARVGRRAAEISMAPDGLRPRHLIALTLLSEHGAVSQHALSEALSLDPSNVVGLLNELEERELITRRRDPTDRRRHIVELSPRGEDELRIAYARLRCVEDELLSALSPGERDTLHDLLVRAVGVTSVTCTLEMDPPTCAG